MIDMQYYDLLKCVGLFKFTAILENIMRSIEQRPATLLVVEEESGVKTLVDFAVEAAGKRLHETMPVEKWAECMDGVNLLPEYVKKKVFDSALQKLPIEEGAEWICKLGLREDLEEELFKVTYPKEELFKLVYPKGQELGSILGDVIYRQKLFNQRWIGLGELIHKQQDPGEKKSLQERLELLQQKSPFLEENLTSEELGAWTKWIEEELARGRGWEELSTGRGDDDW